LWRVVDAPLLCPAPIRPSLFSRANRFDRLTAIVRGDTLRQVLDVEDGSDASDVIIHAQKRGLMSRRRKWQLRVSEREQREQVRSAVLRLRQESE